MSLVSESSVLEGAQLWRAYTLKVCPKIFMAFSFKNAGVLAYIDPVTTVGPISEEDEWSIVDPDLQLMQLPLLDAVSHLTTPSHIKVDPANVREENFGVPCVY